MSSFERAAQSKTVMLKRHAMTLCKDVDGANSIVASTIKLAGLHRSIFFRGAIDLDAFMLACLAVTHLWIRADPISKGRHQQFLDEIEPTQRMRVTEVAQVLRSYGVNQFSPEPAETKIPTVTSPDRARAFAQASYAAVTVPDGNLDLRPIDPSPFLAAYATRSEMITQTDGVRPVLQWIGIVSLRIDPNYQREIGRRGANNILNIAVNFDWSKFGTVIVASIGDGLYAIVDGQHRTTAAAVRGILDVPCQIIEATPGQQAASFVAINGNVTQMSIQQVHAAQIASGDKKAKQLEQLCRASGVTICRYPVPANKIKPGHTLAVGALRSAMKQYGAEVLSEALRCIAMTGNGNPGMVRAQIIKSLCDVLSRSPRLVHSGHAYKVCQNVNFAQLFDRAGIEARQQRCPLTTVLSRRFGDVMNARDAA